MKKTTIKGTFMIKTITFKHKTGNEQYLVEVDYIDTPPTVSSPHNASCPTDYLGEREILDVNVYTLDGDDVSDSVSVSDESIWFEIDINKEVGQFERDLEGLTMKHIAEEKWWYYEK